MVWLTHEEIEAALRSKSPLFQGYIPGNNQLLDAFNDALTETLAKKGVTAPGVVVAATLRSGEVYHVSGITFTGCPLFSAEAFAAPVAESSRALQYSAANNQESVISSLWASSQ